MEHGQSGDRICPDLGNLLILLRNSRLSEDKSDCPIVSAESVWFLFLGTLGRAMSKGKGHAAATVSRVGRIAVYPALPSTKPQTHKAQLGLLWVDRPMVSVCQTLFQSRTCAWRFSSSCETFDWPGRVCTRHTLTAPGGTLPTRPAMRYLRRSGIHHERCLNSTARASKSSHIVSNLVSSIWCLRACRAML